MRVTNIINLQKILKIALKVCSGAEYKTFASWMQHKEGYDPTSEQIAKETDRHYQNVARDFISMAAKGVIRKGQKEKIPFSKNRKNTYELGPLFDSIFGIVGSDKRKSDLQTPKYIPLKSIETFQKIGERVLLLAEIVATHKLKIGKYDGKRFAKMKNKMNEIETLISASKFKNIDYKINDLVVLAEENVLWIKNRLDDLYYNDALDHEIQLPVFDDLDLPKLKETIKTTTQN